MSSAPIAAALGPTDPVQLVLSHLKGARRTGAGWQARCPAHDDRTPSLSISHGDDGRALLKCHSGCSFESIVSTLGIREADLFPARPDTISSRAVECHYVYTDEAGAPLFRAVRTNPKGFYQQRADGHGGWANGVHGVRQVPYNLPAVRGKAAAGGVVFVAEGEKDCHALTALGLVATTNAGGAGKWTATHAEHLRGARVVVLPDNDDPGRSHAENVARLCADAGATWVRVVELPGLAPKGDVSDWLAAGGQRGALEQLVHDAAPWMPKPEPELAAAAKTETTYRARSLAVIMKDPDVLKPPQALVGRVVFPSRVTMLAAREKSGKSTLTTAIVAAYTTGQAFLGGDIAPPGDVLWISLEEFDGDLVQRLVAFGVDPTRFYLAGPGEIADMRDVEHEGSRPGLGLVVIDSLSKIAEREGIDEGGNAQKWSALLSRITQLARSTKAAVLLIHHMNKDGGYRDSTSIGAGVDIIVEMDEGSPDDPTLRKLRPRGRISVPGFSVRYDPAGPRFVVAGGEMTPDARALAHAAANPGLSKSALAGALGGRLKDALDLIDGLLLRGALVDRGNKSGAKLYVSGPAEPTPITPTPPFPEAVPDESRETLWETLPDRFPTTSAPVPEALTRFPTGSVSRADPLGPANGKRSPNLSGKGTLSAPTEIGPSSLEGGVL
jgi:putative DNA primase/helicase